MGTFNENERTENERIEISYKNDIKVLSGILFASALAIWFVSWLVQCNVLVAVAPVLLFEAIRVEVANYRAGRGRKAHK